MTLLFLRLYFFRKETFLLGILQDLFIAAEISFLPKILTIPLFLYQWIGILLSSTLEIKIAPSHFKFFRHPKSFLDSIRHLKLRRWIFLGSLASLFPSFLLPLHFLLPCLFLGPLAAIWSRFLPAKTEIFASNPLFYLQWKWLIHPRRENKAPTSSLEPTIHVKKTPLISNKPHVVLILMESFRAESLNAAPRFTEIAKKGIFYPNCYATGQQTYQAILSILYGIQPSLNELSLDKYVKMPLYGLPDILKKEGYQTAFMNGGYLAFDSLDQFFSNHLMDHLIGAEHLGGKDKEMSWGVHDEILFDFALDWLKKQTSPTFSTIVTISNHHPWDPPPGCSISSKTDENRFLKTYSYSDKCLGRFFDRLKENDLLKNTLLIVTGDHGQAFKEKSNSVSRNSLSEPNIRVPLLIYSEKLSSQTIDMPCSHIDIFPTILELLGLEGSSIGQNLLYPEPHPVYFSLSSSAPLKGCRVGDWKWIGQPMGKEAELYNLSNDLKETINLASSEKIKASKLEKETLEYFERVEKTFKEKKWMRKEPIFQGAPELDDTSFIAALENSPSAIDLSACFRLTDKSLIAIGEKIGAKLTQLQIPNSPFITDRGLFAIADHCPHLIRFYAIGTPLITEKGIERILEKCSRLKFVSLDSLSDLKSLNVEKETLPISALFLGEDLAIDLTSLLSKLPFLSYFEANVSKTKLPATLTRLTHLSLYQFMESDLSQLLKANPDLFRLKLSLCPNLRQLDLSQTKIRELSLSECPLLEHSKSSYSSF